jgi:hypothetical protein
MIRNLILALGACLLLGFSAGAWMRAKTWRLKRQRRGHPDLPQFVDYFRSKGIPPEVPAAVYQHLTNLRGTHDLPIEPNDKLGDVCRIANEELNDAYTSILTRTGRRMPESRKQEAFAVDTVEEMVRFVADLPL